MQGLIKQLEPMIPALRGYARALLCDAHDADDLVQDCLERVITKWSDRRDEASTRQWVFAIAHNLAMDALRRRKRRGALVSIENLDVPELRVDAPQEMHMQRLEMIRAFNALSDEQRSVVLLVSVHDMSYAEVAAMLGIPVGTVMSRLSRGRARLLDWMNCSARPSPSGQIGAALRRVK